MNEWKVPETVDKAQTWTVITFDEFTCVVPTTDSQPHELESLSCPCKPRVEMEDGVTMVTHNSWRDEKSIDESLKGLFS